MRKFHKTDNLRIERINAPSKVLKASDLYRIEKLKYNRNEKKRTVKQEIKKGLEKLSCDFL